MPTEKTKILLFGWEHHLQSLMQENELKDIAENYEIVFAELPNQALDKIARAKWVDKNPIRAIVFKRDSLIVRHSACKELNTFASDYCEEYFISICMIRNDQDEEARDNAVSGFFAKEEDWSRVKVRLDNLIH